MGRQLIDDVSTLVAPPGEGPGGRRASKFFKALSDGTRRQTLILLEERERTVGEIVACFDLAQPTISRHLSVLKDADLVTSRREGQHTTYRLTSDGIVRAMLDFFRHFEQCRRYLPPE